MDREIFQIEAPVASAVPMFNNAPATEWQEGAFISELTKLAKKYLPREEANELFDAFAGRLGDNNDWRNYASLLGDVALNNSVKITPDELEEAFQEVERRTGAVLDPNFEKLLKVITKNSEQLENSDIRKELSAIKKDLFYHKQVEAIEGRGSLALGIVLKMIPSVIGGAIAPGVNPVTGAIIGAVCATLITTAKYMFYNSIKKPRGTLSNKPNPTLTPN